MAASATPRPTNRCIYGVNLQILRHRIHKFGCSCHLSVNNGRVKREKHTYAV